MRRTAHNPVRHTTIWTEPSAKRKTLMPKMCKIWFYKPCNPAKCAAMRRILLSPPHRKTALWRNSARNRRMVNLSRSTFIPWNRRLKKALFWMWSPITPLIKVFMKSPNRLKIIRNLIVRRHKAVWKLMWSALNKRLILKQRWCWIILSSKSLTVKNSKAKPREWW